MLGRALLLALTCLLVAACGGSSPTPTPAALPSVGASADASGDASVQPSFAESPSDSSPVVDEAFCGTIADLDTALTDFRAIKVKPANGQRLHDQAGAVSTTMDAITQAASDADAPLAGSLATTVDELVSAAEDYATASGTLDTQQKRIKKALNNIDMAITDLRTASGCTT